jgi:prepilin-type processing-associated H-X9-DG protein
LGLPPEYELTYWGDPGIWLELGVPGPSGNTGAAPLLAMTQRRHGGRYNVVFYDAHVENLRARDLFDARQAQELKRWNRDNLPHPESVPSGLRP